MGLPSTFPDPSSPVGHFTGNVGIFRQRITSYDVPFEIEVLENGLYLTTTRFQGIGPLLAPGSYSHGDIVLLQVVHHFLNARQERYGWPCFILGLISAPQVLLGSEGDVWEK